MFVIIFQSSKIDYTALLSGARQSLAGGAVHRERPNTWAPAAFPEVAVGEECQNPTNCKKMDNFRPAKVVSEMFRIFLYLHEANVVGFIG